MFFVYMMSSRRNGTIYIGQTAELTLRVEQHKSGEFEGFAKDYNCHLLVWFEMHETRESAFKRERQMKDWDRSWKIRRIEDLNPQWQDLYVGITLDDFSDPKRRFPSDKHLRLGHPPSRN